MKYCGTTTTNHPVSIMYPRCLQDINTVNIREGYTEHVSLFEDAELVINLDYVEGQIASKEKRSPVKSMDMAFGITNDKASIKQMVMVELRFNYVNMKNLTRPELIKKVAGSLLALGTHIPVYKDYIFVFQKNLKAQAKNRFFRMDPKIGSNFIVMDIYDLKTIFFD